MTNRRIIASLLVYVVSLPVCPLLSGILTSARGHQDIVKDDHDFPQEHRIAGKQMSPAIPMSEESMHVKL